MTWAGNRGSSVTRNFELVVGVNGWNPAGGYVSLSYDYTFEDGNLQRVLMYLKPEGFTLQENCSSTVRRPFGPR